MHEHKAATIEEIAGGSDKSFGLVFAAVFTVVGIFPLLHGNNLRLWALVLAVVFAIAAFIFPSILSPLNKLWTKFGILLHSVMNPLILGVLFFAVITPMSLVMRVLGKRPLQLNTANVASYWIIRSKPELAPESFNNQF